MTVTTYTTPETVPATYAGLKFRSMSEAVFAWRLDIAGVPWFYEPTLVTFADGVRYLPDFWIPWAGCWLEVKGPHDERLWKPQALAATGPRPVLLGRVARLPADGTAELAVAPLTPANALPAVFTSPAWQNAAQGFLWPRPPIRGGMA